MPSLHELQVDFMDALLDTASAGRAAALIAGPRARAERRFEVYATTVRRNFADALMSTFPAVHRLVGEDYFRQAAQGLQRLHPSRCGDLTHAGGEFPDYLALLHREDGYGYLADVARLEWSIQESLLAADHAPLDLAALARVVPEAYGELRFEAHPALRLFESPYPALAIWEANVGADAEPPPIDLKRGGERLAILRHRLQLRFHRLSPGEQSFLRAIVRGGQFSEAVERGAADDADFDATAALQRFVSCEAIVAFTLPPPAHTSR
jgi:hypothetical protein